MSITGIVNNNEIPEVAEFLKSSMPDRSDFKSYRYHKAFLTTREVIAPYNLELPAYASTVGTAFDYYARFEIARQLKSKELKMASTDIVAKYGINFLAELGFTYDVRYASRKYSEHMENIVDYIDGYDMPEIWLESACCFFATLEHFIRCGKLKKETLYMEDVSREISTDLKNLINGFRKEFIGKYVNPNSIVVFNPTFRCFDGGDADIFIDGTLYDFKTSKSLGYKGSEEAQIWAYFLLHEIDKKNIEIDLFSRSDINRIGIYKARCADVDYVDIDREKHNVMENALNLEKLLKTYKLYKGYNYRRDEEDFKNARRASNQDE